MKTAYGKLALLAIALAAALLLFAPMRSGLEDYLYARPGLIKMNRGDTYDITYHLISENPQVVSFTSTDTTVAAVNSAGKVTAMGPGEAQIRLKARDGAKAVVRVKVAGNPATSLSLNASALAMEKGQVTGLRALFDQDAEETLVEWSSLDEQVAQVDAVGRVTAVGGGKTRVVARTPNGVTAEAEISVHVSGTAVRIIPEDVTVGIGTRLRLGSYYLPDDTTDEITHWTSSDETVLRVENDGTMEAVGIGSAVLGVFSAEGLSGSTVIRVEPSAADFAISPTAATLERGNAFELVPRFINAEGQLDERSSGHYITWVSSDPEVASVESGLVKALKSGRTRITAYADGMESTCDLRVQVLVHEVRLDINEVYLLREQTVNPIQLNAQVVPADADEPWITFTSDNELVATVNDDGLVSPTGGYGTAVITARAQSGAEARFTLNVVLQLPEGYDASAPAEDAAFQE